MASQNVYSPSYDDEGNPKPSIPELAHQIETAVNSAVADVEEAESDALQEIRDSENSAVSTVENLVLDAQAASDSAGAARDESVAARAAAEQTAKDIGAVGGVDDTVETVGDLPSSSGDDSVFYVLDDTQYYQDTGGGSVAGGWEEVGPNISLNASQIGHLVAVPKTAGAKVFIIGNYASVDDAVQAADDYISNNGGGQVLLGAGVDLDPTSVSISNAGPYVRDDNRSDVIDVRAFGARSGSSSSTNVEAITAALDQAAALPASERRPVHFGDRMFDVDQEIVIPGGVTALFTEQGGLNLTADVHGLRLKGNAQIVEPTVDASGVGGYSSTLLRLIAKDHSNLGKQTRIKGGELFNGTQATAGTAAAGLELVAEATQTDEYILGVMFWGGLRIEGVETGLSMKTASGDTNGNFINGNRFSDLYLRNCITFYDFDAAVDNVISGNIFRGHQLLGQRNETEDALIAKGSFKNNIFRDIRIWDAQYYATEIPHIKFFYPANRNSIEYFGKGNIGADEEGSNEITNLQEKRSQNPTTVGFPAAAGSRRENILGHQDNFLAFADNRFTVTQTSGPSPDAGGLTDLFEPSVSEDVRWSSAPSSDIVIEIDFGSQIPFVQAVAVQFRYDLAESITFEAFQNGDWYTFYDTSSNISKCVVGSGNINLQFDTKFRVTINSSSSIRISRVLGFSAAELGHTYLQRNGGDVYRAINVVNDFFGYEVEGDQVISSRQNAVGKLTDNTGGSTDDTLAAVSGSGDDSTINNNLAELNAKLDAILDALGQSSGHGLTGD